MVDRSYRICVPVVLGSSNPAKGGTSFGGVARNVADNLAHLGVRVTLVSVVGDDGPGRGLLDDLDRIGIDRWAVRPLAGRTTATYAAVLDAAGELVIGIADMDTLDEITPDRIAEPLSQVEPGSWVFADANLPSATHTRLATERRTRGLRLAVDTVSVAKAARLPADLGAIDILFTNLDEARALLGDRGRPVGSTPEETAASLVDAGVVAAVVTLGGDGQLVASIDGIHHSPAAPAKVHDVSGAGDALVGGTLADVVGGADLLQAVRTGAAAAALATESPSTVPADLSAASVAARRRLLP